MNKLNLFLLLFLSLSQQCWAEDKTLLTSGDSEVKEEILTSVPLDEINQASGTSIESKGGIFDILFGSSTNSSVNDIDGEADEKPVHLLVESFKEGAFYNTVYVQIIDRTIGKVYLLSLAIGETKSFNDLELKALSCWQPTEYSITAKSRALFEISSNLPSEDNSGGRYKSIYNGWLIASNPASAYVKHPKFDISLRNCETVKIAPSSAVAN